MVKVLVVDDHAMFRTGVRAELAAQPGIEVVADAEDVDTAVAAIAAHRPEVVLLDVHLPGGGGVEVMRRMPPRRSDATDASGPAYLALSVSDAAEDVIGTIRGGSGRATWHCSSSSSKKATWRSASCGSMERRTLGFSSRAFWRW